MFNEVSLNYTISIGIAEVDDATNSHETWIEHADSALYRSKEGGRNKTSLHVKSEP
jgi:diguanylate cyclase (GGDEF)-like protein